MPANRLLAALLTLCLASTVSAQVPPPQRSTNGDIDDTYEKPAQSSPWGSVLTSLGLGDFQKSHALIVGISEFDNFADLPTQGDPIRMREYLIEDAGFDVVITLTGQNATKARIDELMVEHFPETVSENDRFLFYWSGHGVTRSRNTSKFGFLPLATSPPTGWSTMVAMADIARWNTYLEASQVLYLLDSCFSGLAGAAPMSAGIRALNEAQLMGPARHLLTAGTGDQQTIAIDRLGGSVFTAAVIDGLRKGLADTANGGYPADGLISVDELKLYVSSRVVDEASTSGWDNPITPQLREMSTNTGAFFFTVPDGRYGTRADATNETEEEEPDNDTVIGMGAGDRQSVITFQEGLTEMGLYTGPADGVLSFETQKAIGQFQGMEDLPITGTPDAPTRQRLLERLIEAKLEAPEPTPPPPQTSFTDCAACPQMIPLPGGTVTLGAQNSDHPEEGPVHEATLAPFAMARTEITGDEWAAYIAARPEAESLDSYEGCYIWDYSSSPPRMRRQTFARQLSDASQPQTCLSHRDALGYVDWLNEVSGGGYRLPTEAEMEYALLSQTLPTDPAAACTLFNGALAGPPFNRGGACPVSSPLIKPVASFEPNPLGLHDLYGNLWELMHNCWTPRADDYLTKAQDLGPCTSGTVPVRGASFDDPPQNYRPSIRQQVPNIRRQENIGFRVVKFPL